ncbi:MAG: O-unit flippase [Geobacteraceae bacterium GWC2_58_44]|nr:MAG: O-unit flippase [Geobacteraceae bacterium GWC2_58_44]HBG06063.1 flippase [Geobacter sp.]
MNQAWVKHLPVFLQKRLEGRQELQKVVGNTGWLFADRLLRMGVGLVVGIWIARYLGPARYGMLSYAASLVGIFTSFAILGLEGIIIRDLVRFPDREQEILGTTFSLRLFAGLCSYLLVVATIYILRPEDGLSQMLVAVMGWVLIFSSADTIDLWFQSKVRSKYVVYAKNAAFLVSSGLRLALVLMKAPILAFAVANTVEAAVGAVALVYVYHGNGQVVARWRTSLALARELLKDCWPLVLSGVVYMISLRIDQVMLGQMADAHEVGIYASAVKIAEIWFFIPTALVTSVFPNIVKAKESSEEEFHGRMQKLYNLLAFVGYAIAIPTSLLAGFVVHLLYGDAYAAAAPMLVFLIWSDLFVNLGVARNSYLLAMGWSWSLFSMAVSGTVLNIVLNLFLIPRYGGTGAAIATCISYWLAAHGACYLYRPLRRSANMITRALIYPRFW